MVHFPVWTDSFERTICVYPFYFPDTIHPIGVAVPPLGGMDIMCTLVGMIGGHLFIKQDTIID